MHVRFEAKLGEHIFRSGDRYNINTEVLMGTKEFAKVVNPVTLVYTCQVDMFANPHHPYYNHMIWYAYSFLDGRSSKQITPNDLFAVSVRPEGKID